MCFFLVFSSPASPYVSSYMSPMIAGDTADDTLLATLCSSYEVGNVEIAEVKHTCFRCISE